jgi:hypothetical protein
MFLAALVSAATINQLGGPALVWWVCCVPERSASPVMARHMLTHLAPSPWRGFCFGHLSPPP